MGTTKMCQPGKLIHFSYNNYYTHTWTRMKTSKHRRIFNYVFNKNIIVIQNAASILYILVQSLRWELLHLEFRLHRDCNVIIINWRTVNQTDKQINTFYRAVVLLKPIFNVREWWPKLYCNRLQNGNILLIKKFCYQ